MDWFISEVADDQVSMALRATSESSCVVVGERGDAGLVIPRDGASRGERGAGGGI